MRSVLRVARATARGSNSYVYPNLIQNGARRWNSAAAAAAEVPTSSQPSDVSNSSPLSSSSSSPPPPAIPRDPFERPPPVLYSTLDKDARRTQRAKENLDPIAPAPGIVQVRDKENQFPFSSLKGTIDYDTFKAITVKPFQHTHMTAVQHAVLSLLPELARPYRPDQPPPATKDSKVRRDLLVKAKTGTGKTLAFLVPAIEARLAAIMSNSKQAVLDAGFESNKSMEGQAARMYTRKSVGTLIISPTRELATQIANEAIRLTAHHKGFEVRLFTGGVSKKMQVRDFMRGRRDIVVATPGRLRDLLRSVSEVADGMKSLNQLILDEADTLLDMGFRADLEDILSFIPKAPQRQTFLFSATVSTRIQQIAKEALAKDFKFINTVSDSDAPTHTNIPQYHTILPSAAHQIPHILRLIAHDQLTNPGSSKIVFFLPSTKLTQLFANILRSIGRTILPSGTDSKIYEIHSKKDQEARYRSSDGFRKDTSGASILVTSDVSARGVDYPNVTRVIQVGMPPSTDQYVHRIGRTGRGRTTTAGRGDIVFLPWEMGYLTWQLTDIKIKPVLVTELQKEVAELAAKHDADPSSFFASSGTGIQGFPHPSISKLVGDELEKTVQKTVARLDPEEIKETFASLLGYYIPKSHEIRVQRPVLVEGLKKWTTQALGLPEPPYVSQAFLQKLGLHDHRTLRFGRNTQAELEKHELRSHRAKASGMDFQQGKSSFERSRPHWDVRGAVRNSTKIRTPKWVESGGELEPTDPDPEEYKSTRYNQRMRRPTREQERKTASDRY